MRVRELFCSAIRAFSVESSALIFSCVLDRDALKPCCFWRIADSSLRSSCWRLAVGESWLLGLAVSILALTWFCSGQCP
jgi:hypothetical protein